MSSDAKEVLTQLEAVGQTAANEPLLGQNNYYTEVIAGAASGDQTAVAGGLAVQVITNTTTAGIGDGTSVKSAGAVSVTADDQAGSKTLVGNLSASGGSTAVGISSAILVNSSSVSSTIGVGATISQSSAVSVNATASQDIDVIEVSAAAADENGIDGILGAVTSMVAVTASVGQGASVTTSGAFGVLATNKIGVLNIGGVIAAGGENAVGGTAIVTTIGTAGNNNSAEAYVASSRADATTINAGSVDIEGVATENLINVAIAGGFAGENAIAGVATPLTQFVTAEGYVGAGAKLTIGGDVGVKASDTAQVVNVAGVVAVGGENGVGGSAAVSTLSDTTQAYIGDGSSVDATGAVSVSAFASEGMTMAVVSGGVGGDVGAVGSLASSIILDTTEAYLGHAVEVGAAMAPSSVSVTATDNSAIFDFSGALGVGGSAGVGASADVNVLIKNTYAWIGRDNATEALTPADAASVQVGAGDVTVSAQSSETVISLVVGFAVGGEAGLAGTVAVYTLTGNTLASIGDDSMVTADGNVAVLANDVGDVSRVAASVAIGGEIGGGAGIGVTVSDQTTDATIGAGATIVALGQGTGLEVTTGYAGTFSAFGSSAAVRPPSSTLTQSANSDLDPTTVDEAVTEGGSLLTLLRAASPSRTTVHGVVVNATAANSILSLSVGAAGGGEGAVAISGDLPIVISDTEATIGASAKINATGVPASAQSVSVAAASDLYHLGVTGSIAGGGAAGIGAGAETNVFKNTTIASVGAGSVVDAASNVDVTAKASEDYAGAAANAGIGGDVGVAGTITGLVVIDVTKAFIDSASTAVSSVDAGGSVVVAADDETRAIVVSGTLAIGIGTAGVGAGVGVSVLSKDTEAYVGDDASVTALGFGVNSNFAAYTAANSATTSPGQGLLVEANSGESLALYAVAGAGGLYAGVAGVVSVEAISPKTEAYIGDGATINGPGGGVAPASGQDVDVTARDSTVVSVIDAGLAIGIAAVGGAVDVAVVQNTTSAFIGDGSTVNATNDVLVNALTNQAASSTVATVAGGVGGFGAAISVLAIANGETPDQSSQTSNSRGSTGGSADTELQDNSINKDLASSSNANVTVASAKAQTYKSGLSASAGLAANTIPPGTSATIGDVKIVAGGTVGTTAQDSVSASLADGAVTLAIGASAGVGAATVNVANTATIGNGADISAGAVSVSATSGRTFSAIGISGTAAGGAVAAMVVQDGSTTSASIDDATVSAAGSVNVAAHETTISSESTASVAGGIGAGVTIGVFTPMTTASIANGADVTAGTIQGNVATSIGDVIVDAEGSQSLSIAGAGLAPGGIAGGALTVYVVNDQTKADIGDAIVTATGNVAALANNSVAGDVLVGGFAAGGVSGGGAFGVSVLSTTTAASIDGGADVTAYGLNPTGVDYVQSYDGTFRILFGRLADRAGAAEECLLRQRRFPGSADDRRRDQRRRRTPSPAARVVSEFADGSRRRGRGIERRRGSDGGCERGVGSGRDLARGGRSGRHREYDGDDRRIRKDRSACSRHARPRPVGHGRRGE